MDSMGILHLISFVEGKYGIHVEDGELVTDNWDSICRMSRYIRGKLGAMESAEQAPEKPAAFRSCGVGTIRPFQEALRNVRRRPKCCRLPPGRWKDSRHPALLFLNETCSYGQLSSASNSVSAFLLSHGVAEKGDRVILIADNSPLWVATYLGALRAGLVCVSLPVNTAPDDLAYVLANTEARFGFSYKTAYWQKNAPCLGALTLVTVTLRARFSRRRQLRDPHLPKYLVMRRLCVAPESGGDDLAALDVHVRVHGNAARRNDFTSEHHCKYGFDNRVPAADQK